MGCNLAGMPVFSGGLPFHLITMPQRNLAPHKTKNNNKKKRQNSDNSQFSTFVDVKVPLPKTEALRNARDARLLILAFLNGNRKPKANQPFLEGHLILTQSHLLDPSSTGPLKLERMKVKPGCFIQSNMSLVRSSLVSIGIVTDYFQANVMPAGKQLAGKP